MALAGRPGSPALVVLRALGLGDLLTSVPALRGLAQAFPEHRRVLLAPRELEPLLALIRTATGTPVIEQLIDAQPSLRAPAAPPPSSGLDIAVNLHGRGPRSHRLLQALRPNRLLAFVHPDVHADAPCAHEGPHWRADEHEVMRWCRLLQEYGIPCDPAALEIDRPGLSASLASSPQASLLHPGAASPARRWPARRWAAVAAAERTAGRAVVITGTTREIALARSIARAAELPQSSVLAGATDLRQLAALVAQAGRVVCGDTGVAHLATALRTPSVLLFGPVSPSLWGPPGDRPWHRVLWHGSQGDPHGRQVDPSLARITVAEVLDALSALTAHTAN